MPTILIVKDSCSLVEESLSPFQIELLMIVSTQLQELPDYETDCRPFLPISASQVVSVMNLSGQRINYGEIKGQIEQLIIPRAYAFATDQLDKEDYTQNDLCMGGLLSAVRFKEGTGCMDIYLNPLLIENIRHLASLTPAIEQEEVVAYLATPSIAEPMVEEKQPVSALRSTPSIKYPWDAPGTPSKPAFPPRPKRFIDHEEKLALYKELTQHLGNMKHRWEHDHELINFMINHAAELDLKKLQQLHTLTLRCSTPLQLPLVLNETGIEFPTSFELSINVSQGNPAFRQLIVGSCR